MFQSSKDCRHIPQMHIREPTTKYNAGIEKDMNRTQSQV